MKPSACSPKRCSRVTWLALPLRPVAAGRELQERRGRVSAPISDNRSNRWFSDDRTPYESINRKGKSVEATAGVLLERARECASISEETTNPAVRARFRLLAEGWLSVNRNQAWLEGEVQTTLRSSRGAALQLARRHRLSSMSKLSVNL